MSITPSRITPSRKILLSAVAIAALTCGLSLSVTTRAHAADAYADPDSLSVDFTESYKKPSDRYAGREATAPEYPLETIPYKKPADTYTGTDTYDAAAPAVPAYKKPSDTYAGREPTAPEYPLETIPYQKPLHSYRAAANQYQPGAPADQPKMEYRPDSKPTTSSSGRGYNIEVRHDAPKSAPSYADSQAAYRPEPTVSNAPQGMSEQTTDESISTSDIQFVPSDAPAAATPAAPQAAPERTNIHETYPDLVTFGCPTFDIHPEMRSITFFKGGDTTQLIANSSLKDVRGSCKIGADGIELDLDLVMSATIGNAGHYQSDPNAEELQSYPYFIALIDTSGNVQFKKIYAAIVRFPVRANATTQVEKVRQFIPMPQGTTARDFTISLGYQLNPDQLSYNRGQVIDTRAIRQDQQSRAQNQDTPRYMRPQATPIVEPATTTPVATTAPVAPAPAQAPQGVYVADSERGAIPEMVDIPLATAPEPSYAASAPTDSTPRALAQPQQDVSEAPTRKSRFLGDRPRLSENPL